MYQLSRVLLMLGMLAGLYCLAIVVAAAVGWPVTGFMLAIVVFGYSTRRGYRRLTTLGSARWADEEDLRRAGMLNASSGLILGRLPANRQRPLPRAIRKLFSRQLTAAEACRGFWAAFRRAQGALVRLPQAVHISVFAPTGGGKNVSCVIPFLMTCEDSCVVVDFKGENAALTAEHRRNAFRHQIVLLDPFKVVTRTPHTFDPLAFIDKEKPLAIDECNDLANALVIRTGDEREPHWNDSAEAWIAALLATVVQYGEPDQGTRSLQTIRDILSDPQKLELAIKLMRESEAWGGLLARMGGQLSHFVEKEKSSVLTTVSRHLRFLDTMAIAESTKTSSFDPAGLRAGKMTVYLILPPDHMRAQSALLRMWIGSLLRAVVRGGLQQRNKVHFILDEAASLGHMEAIDDAVDKYRGYGIRLQFYFQSLGQLRRSFPDGQELTLLSNSSQLFFAANETTTADYVSARLGEETIIVDSGGTSKGYSEQHTSGEHPTRSTGRSTNFNANWQPQARKLLQSAEVIALSPREAITFTPGVPPVFTTLLKYYEEKDLGQRPHEPVGARAACCMFAVSTALCAAYVWLAVLLTLGLEAATAKQKPVPQQQQYRNTWDQRPGVSGKPNSPWQEPGLPPLTGSNTRLSGRLPRAVSGQEKRWRAAVPPQRYQSQPQFFGKH